MKNIYDVLRQKENELTQLQKEIEALRLAARLLNEEGDGAEQISRSAIAAAGPVIAQPRPTVAAREATPAWGETGLRQFP